jgi:GAF domain-containing protein
MGMTPDQLIGRTWYEIGVPPEAVRVLEETRRRVLETGQPASQKTSLQIGDTRRESEFAFKPVIDADGSIVGTVVTAWDSTEHRQASRARARLERTYSILTAIDQVILRARNSHVILSEACRIAADVGGFELAWVGLLDRASGDVRVVCQAGRDEGLLADVVVSARDEPSGHGVVGTAIRESRSVVIQDVRRDERTALWRSFFDQLSYRTAAAFPIGAAGRTIGALVLYSAKASRFDAAEARLYEQLAEDISGAVDSIETNRGKAEAHSALIESERRYRDLFDISPQAMWVFDIETLRFLAVNNAAILRAFVVATLEHAGYHVLVAASPVQATALSDGLGETIDLLLTDLVMPGGNGRDLAERLLVSRPSLRVVLMSGYDAAPPGDRRDDRFRFLGKPFGADQLVAAVKRAQAEPEA